MKMSRVKEVLLRKYQQEVIRLLTCKDPFREGFSRSSYVLEQAARELGVTEKDIRDPFGNPPEEVPE